MQTLSHLINFAFLLAAFGWLIVGALWLDKALPKWQRAIKQKAVAVMPRVKAPEAAAKAK